MKKLLYALFALLLAWSCSPSKKAISSGSHPPKIVDSTEYEAIIIDTEFEHWYLLNYSDAKDFSNEYYRGKNHVAVTHWNDYSTRHLYPHIIDESIIYDYSIDYGIEVNRKLYWYFKYIEDKFKIRLLH
jgi:hypothetical protein